jgi:hypothetical protein
MPDEAPSMEDQPINGNEVDEPSGEDQNQPEDGDQESAASFADFDYEGIPDDLRGDVEKRIKGFQGSYTKAMQELSQNRQELDGVRDRAEALDAIIENPALLAQLGLDERSVLEAFGYQPGDDEEQEYLEPEELNAREIAALKAERAQEVQERQLTEAQEAEEEHIIDEIAALEDQFDEEFSEKEMRLLANFARTNPDRQGRPNVKAAHEALREVLDGRKEAWKESLKRPTPRVPGQGPAGSKAADLSTEEGRNARGLAAVEAAMASRGS